jgi:hypothetical protein
MESDADAFADHKSQWHEVKNLAREEVFMFRGTAERESVRLISP